MKANREQQKDNGAPVPGQKKTRKISGATAEQRSQQQAMGRNLGPVNDQGRDGKERRTSSPHNR